MNCSVKKLITPKWTRVCRNGKSARGKTLGTNHEVDAGMMQITSDGPWPHVEMGSLDEARLGERRFDLDRRLFVDDDARGCAARAVRLGAAVDEGLRERIELVAGEHREQRRGVGRRPRAGHPAEHA